MKENIEILKEALELFKTKGIVFRDSVGHYTVDKLIEIYKNEADKKEVLFDINVRDLFEIEPFDDNGIPCYTVSVKGLNDKHSRRTFRLDDLQIENILDDEVMFFWLHEHFEIVVGKKYFDLIKQMKTTKK
ncbi:MAG: hypothetical protein RBR02_09275 [Desulfuromonadaceae bacterium]|nr:hypothetical protein [Desulfuromonadaceae bacterium]